MLLRPRSPRKVVQIFANSAKRHLFSELGFASKIPSSRHRLDYFVFPLVCRSEGWTPAVDIPIWLSGYITLEYWK